MKKDKRLGAALAGLLAALTLLPSAALAAGRIDLTRDVGLTLTCKDGETALSGAAFSLYHVAAVDETGELTARTPFDQSGVELDIRGKNDEAWRAAATTLEGYVQARKLTPADSGTTGADGVLAFPTGAGKLEPGLYLVTGRRHAQDGYYYDPAPFMALLPDHGTENDWVYQVAASVKFDRTDVPSEDDDETVDRVVKKVWQDGDSEDRPTSVTVRLLRNGEVYETVTLNAENRWRYTWTGLDAHDRWTVTEMEVPAGYTVSVTREGAVFVVTNRLREEGPEEPELPNPPEEPDGPEHPDTPTLPQTGQLWWPVPVLLCGGLALICVGLLRRRESDET